MVVITDSATLAAACARFRQLPYVAIDTEFMRESTYWPRLCLVQMAGGGEAVAIDTLASGLDLAPLDALLHAPEVLKVFHAARQDLEIFYLRTRRVPAPLFDTQIAAMVCGFGDAVAYQTLVSSLTGKSLDKGSRFTDWSHRPLTERQIRYALNDVHHLCTVYEKLATQLADSHREAWVAEELAGLSDPAIYLVTPEDAWLRIKRRTNHPRTLAILREVAAWREIESQRRDLPRGRVARDEALTEIAASAPRTVAELARIRALPQALAERREGTELLAAVKRGLDLGEDALPRVAMPKPPPRGIGPIVELLKVLLRLASEQHHVAPKLLASADDLEKIAVDPAADVPVLHGWRREIFGADALRLARGEVALAVTCRRLRLVALPDAAAEAADQPARSSGRRP
ncbi:MAG: ribonuclease D [Alphaproteobacteria bacterium]|nr:ribonuclease D [Alphaproteobacteria bacterium]